MNWIDGLVLLVIGLNMFKGYSLGLMLSLFNILQVVISLAITKGYYMRVYELIRESSILMTMFNRIIYFFFNIIFYRKNRLEVGFVDGLMGTGIVDTIILGFALLFVYKISTIIIDILFSLFSFLLDIRIFRKLDRYGGMFFGLLKAFLGLMILDSVMRPILLEIPDLFLSRAYLESEFLEIIRLNFMGSSRL